MSSNKRVEEYINSLPSDIEEVDIPFTIYNMPINEFKVHDLPTNILLRFTNLIILTIANIDLPKLPKLPDTLIQLRCNGNRLTQLPELPIGLTELYCFVNMLSQLPTLPDTLIKLYCGSNKLTQLPTLPIGLTELLCDDNLLTELPKLPDGLIQLWCQYNSIILLPTLPNGLIQLHCNDNHLIRLPQIHSNLQTLILSFNPVINTIFDTYGFCKQICPDHSMLYPHYFNNLYNKIVVINHFHEMFYMLKFKTRLRNILYKIREKHAMVKYHPINLEKLLADEGIDETKIDEMLENW